MLISLSKYAAAHGRSQISVQQKARRGGFKTAKKIGRNWVIDSEEPYVKMKKGELQMYNAGIVEAKTAGQKSKLK
jgi:hypothetical protein